MPSSRGYHPTRASMMCGSATPGPQVPPPQAGCSPGTAGEAPRARELSSLPPLACWGTKARRSKRSWWPRQPEASSTSGTENPCCLSDCPPKGCDPAGTTLAGPDGRHASLTPRDKTGKSRGFACSSPFLIPLSLSVCPSSTHPSPCVTSPPWLRAGGREDLNLGSSLKSCPTSSAWE